jgi:hypothetical protein
VFAGFRERLAVSKQATYKFYFESSRFKKLKEVEIKGVKISKTFSVLGTFDGDDDDDDDDADINRPWETITENIKISTKVNL